MATSSYRDPSRKGGSIQTFTGKIFYPLDPRVEDIELIDVAHGLSNKCRFTGHTRKFYGTGEHSVRVSWLLESMGYDLMTQFVGLHHDDTDAYLPDVPTPLKILQEFQWFRDLEHSMQELCYQRFGAVVGDYKPVKKADVILLLTEKRDLMSTINSDWCMKYDEVPIPYPYKIEPWHPETAFQIYMERHKMLEHAILQGNQKQGSFPGTQETSR